jgi:hypothetical protein
MTWVLQVSLAHPPDDLPTLFYGRQRSSKHRSLKQTLDAPASSGDWLGFGAGCDACVTALLSSASGATEVAGVIGGGAGALCPALAAGVAGCSPVTVAAGAGESGGAVATTVVGAGCEAAGGRALSGGASMASETGLGDAGGAAHGAMAGISCARVELGEDSAAGALAMASVMGLAGAGAGVGAGVVAFCRRADRELFEDDELFAGDRSMGLSAAVLLPVGVESCGEPGASVALRFLGEALAGVANKRESLESETNRHQKAAKSTNARTMRPHTRFRCRCRACVE